MTEFVMCRWSSAWYVDDRVRDTHLDDRVRDTHLDDRVCDTGLSDRVYEILFPWLCDVSMIKRVICRW